MLPSAFAVVPVIETAGELHGHDPRFFLCRDVAARVARRCRDHYVGVMVVAVYPRLDGKADDLVLVHQHGAVPQALPQLN